MSTARKLMEAANKRIRVRKAEKLIEQYLGEQAAFPEYDKANGVWLVRLSGRVYTFGDKVAAMAFYKKNSK